MRGICGKFFRRRSVEAEMSVYAPARSVFSGIRRSRAAGMIRLLLLLLLLMMMVMRMMMVRDRRRRFVYGR